VSALVIECLKVLEFSSKFGDSFKTDTCGDSFKTDTCGDSFKTDTCLIMKTKC